MKKNKFNIFLSIWFGVLVGVVSTVGTIEVNKYYTQKWHEVARFKVEYVILMGYGGTDIRTIVIEENQHGEQRAFQITDEGRQYMNVEYAKTLR